jgi:hypothetical protein
MVRAGAAGVSNGIGFPSRGRGSGGFRSSDGGRTGGFAERIFNDLNCLNSNLAPLVSAPLPWRRFLEKPGRKYGKEKAKRYVDITKEEGVNCW